EAYVHSAAQALLADGPLPDDTVLAAFGGAGPMTICGAARQAGARRVIVPRTAAVFSAVGIGFSDLTQDYQYPLAGAGDAAIARAVDQLNDRARRDMSAEGVRLEDCIASYRLVRGADGAETVVELDDPEQAQAHFHDGDTASLELSLVSPLPHVGIRDTDSAPASSATASGVRSVLDRAGGAMDLPVYTLLDLPVAAQADGPAVIEGPFFTMRLPVGWRFQTTAAGDLLLTDQGSN
ncbi:MAG: hydantoinase/oxoprolinase family protein, partial [Streptosporangiaceae bacterium]